jgi:hypothetical protein
MKTKIPLVLSIFLGSCSISKEASKIGAMNPNSKTIQCYLIEKEFINKGGKITSYKELYLRCSIQDYFIKICAGNVNAEQLKPYINAGIEVEMEIREGMLDHCSDNLAHVQSRIGTYAVIKKIIK